MTSNQSHCYAYKLQTMTSITNRPRVFLDIQIGISPVGRITVELFADKTPKTCEK